MGQPVRIVDLARDMIELSGLQPGDIDIKFVGTRPGEKICEELSMHDEDTLSTSHPRIRMLRGTLSVDSQCLHESIQDLISHARCGDEYQTRVGLMELAAMNSKCPVPTDKKTPPSPAERPALNMPGADAPGTPPTTLPAGRTSTE